MNTAEEALNIILGSVALLPDECVPLLRAHQRVLAQAIVADGDVPFFDNSSMDGFALSSADTRSATEIAPVTLQVVGEVAAGSTFSQAIPEQSAVRIMTGAPIPPGADAVLELEAVVAKNGSVQLGKPVATGRNIRKKGEDILAGSTAVERGTFLRASHMGVLASLGVTTVPVYRKPFVALLTTGNELVGVDQKPQAGQIRNSNAFSLWGLTEESGALPVNLGTARDDEEELALKLREGLQQDMLVTSGGVSVGAYDYMLKLLGQIGVDIKFWKVNIKPGMPLLFGVHHDSARQRDIPVFGLPGNPVSTIVTFLQFVRPAIHKMTGREHAKPIRLAATLEHDFQKKDVKRHFVRGIVRNENNRFVVHSTGSQSSGALTSMVKANCLIVIPEERMEIKAGEEVDIELL